MGEAFDPYYKWLGIPPKDQPPHHYRLLALDLFESDPDVIDAAASKQMTYLRDCATGPHVALSQKLLNELAAARICLLNPEKKAAYDAGLRVRLGAGSEPAVRLCTLPVPVARPPVSANPVVAVQHDMHRKSQPWPVYAALALGVLLLAVLLASMITKPDSDGGIDTTETASRQSKSTGTSSPSKPKPESPVDRSNPSDAPDPQEPPATPTVDERNIVEPAGDGIASPGVDGPSPLRPSSPEPAIGSVTSGTSTEEDEPVGPLNVVDTRTIPPPPADAQDQLKNAFAKAKSPREFEEVARRALEYADQAIVVGDGETARTLVTWAVAAARETQDDDLSKTATLRYLEVQVPLTEEVIEGARKRLRLWRPSLGFRGRASDGVAEVADEAVAASAASQPPLTGLLEGDAHRRHQAVRPSIAASAQVTDLFNGKDLRGWSLGDGKGPKRNDNDWIVDAGRNVLVSSGRGHDWLETVGFYCNFQLWLEWRFPPGTHPSALNGSGVVVRSVGVNSTNLDPKGIEIDIRPRGDSPDAQTAAFIAYESPLETRRGKWTGRGRFHSGAFGQAERPHGEWNLLEITCKDDRITVSLNGVLVNEGWGMTTACGRICLRNQKTAVEFRNIRLALLE